MICPECGATIDDEAYVCDQCGAYVSDGTMEGAVIGPAIGGAVVDQVPQIVQQLQDAPSAIGDEERGVAEPVIDDADVADVPVPVDEGSPDIPLPDPHKNRRVGIIASAVIVAALLAGGAYAGITAYNDNNANEAAHQGHPVVFEVKAKGFGPEDSLIPLSVSGKDMDGNSIEASSAIGPDGTGLELVQGTYEVSIQASPLLDSGELYAVPERTWQVSIPASIKTAAEFAVQDDPIKLKKIPVVEITDEQIIAAYDFALKNGTDQETADAYKAKVTSARDDAVEQARIRSLTPKATKLKRVKKRGKKKLLVTWKRAKKNDAGYQVQYALNKKFTKKAKKKTAGSGVTKVMLKKLKRNKKYYVRVRVFNIIDGQRHYSPWSNIKAARTAKKK